MKKYLLITYGGGLKVLISRDSILYATAGEPASSYTKITWKDRLDISTFCIPFEKFIQALEYFDSDESAGTIVRFNAD